MRELWKRLVEDEDSLVAEATRVLRVGWRTGMLQQQTLRGVARAAPKLLHQPVGAGLIHTLNAGNRGEAPYVVDLERDERVSYRAFDRRLNRLVRGLRRLGLGHKDRLVLMAPNGWHYLLGFFAALRGGFVAVHASYRLTPDELRYILDHSNPRALLFAPSCWPTVQEVRRADPTRELHYLCTDELPDAPEVRTLGGLMARESDRFPPARGRLGAMPSLVYTSGTTGRPKGAVRDFARMGLVEMTHILERLPFQAGERHLVVCPLYHSGAQAFVAFHSAGGSTLVTLPHFDAEQTLRIMVEQRIDSVFLVPTMIHRLLDLPEETKARWRPALRCLVSGAAPFPQPLRERAIETFGPVIYDFYGSTEVGWVTLVDSHEMRARPHTVGRAIAGSRILILGEDGRPLPPGEVGEVCVVSSQQIDEYYGNEKATRDSRRGEAQASGDLGWLDADGYLFLAGRSSDMIISGGVNVYPAEIEQVLERHPDVREAAVVGLPDEAWGERVVAFVTPAAPTTDPAAREALEATLSAHCREHLAGFKTPKTWRFVDALPRNATGKVLKRQLRDLPQGD